MLRLASRLYHLFQNSHSSPMDDLLKTLSADLPRLSPRLRRAAIAVVENPGSVAVHSMRTMAEDAGVSPPTMLRLARRLGFANYRAFRAVFQDALTGPGYGERADQLGRATEQTGIDGLLDAVTRSAVDGLSRLNRPGFGGIVEAAADLIAGARRTFVLASGAAYGPAATFHYVARMAHPAFELVNLPGQGLIDGLATARPGDVVLAVSTAPYARATVEAAHHAQASGLRVVSVTDGPLAPIARGADLVLTVDTRNHHYFPSTIALTATLEVLSAALAIRLGRPGVESVSRFETALNAAAFYWKDDR